MFNHFSIHFLWRNILMKQWIYQKSNIFPFPSSVATVAKENISLILDHEYQDPKVRFERSIFTALQSFLFRKAIHCSSFARFTFIH